MIYNFSKTACGPCILVKKFFANLDDERINDIVTISLDEGVDQTNFDLARKYGVSATPTIIITDESGEKLEEHVGGVEITKNIQDILAKRG